MPAVPAGSPAGACPGQKGHVPAPGTDSLALRYGHGRLVRHARHRPSARGIVAARLPAARQPSQAGLAFPRALCHIYACRAEACRHRCGARSSKPVAGLTVCGRFDSYTPPPLPPTSRPQASCPRTFFCPLLSRHTGDGRAPKIPRVSPARYRGTVSALPFVRLPGIIRSCRAPHPLPRCRPCCWRPALFRPAPASFLPCGFQNCRGAACWRQKTRPTWRLSAFRPSVTNAIWRGCC